MSRTEFKILKETPFWVAAFKLSNTHSDEVEYLCDASKLPFRAVHRLDFETQGILLLARKDKWESYHSLFEHKATDATESSLRAQKIYLAGASSEVDLSDGGHFKGFIGSRYRSSKKTLYTESRAALRGFHSILDAEHIVKKSKSSIFRGKCYEVEIISGRRHQIRSFFASKDAPLMGDALYGNKKGGSLELLSWKLNFIDPETSKKVKLEAPLSYFQK